MKKLYIKLLIAFGVLAPSYVFAASPFLKPVKDLLGDLEIFIQFLNWALPALGILVFFLLIIVYIADKMGFNLGFTLASGTKMGKGGNLVWAMVALACMFAVYGLIQLIGALFGVDTNRAKIMTAPSLPQVGGIRGGGYYNQ